MTASMPTASSINMPPWQRYQQDLQRPEFLRDAAQEDAVKRLQSLYDKLVAAESSRDSKMSKLRRKLGKGTGKKEADHRSVFLGRRWPRKNLSDGHVF